MRVRNVLAVLALALTASAARADIFWYTEQTLGAGQVRSFDSSTDTLGITVALPAAPDPRVSSTYAITAPFDIQALSYAASEGPILAFTDDPFVVIVDILPSSPTYGQVIQTVDMRDAAIAVDTPGVGFLRFHPSGSRIYVTCSGGGTTLPSIRILRQDSPLPAASLSYSFTPATHPNDRIDCGQGTGEASMSGEWGTLGIPEASGTPVEGAIVPWSIDIAPDLSKVYFACHTEMSGVNISNVHGFTIDALGDWVANLTVTELPTTLYDHSYILAFSNSTLSYASGGSRCYVSNTGACPEPAPPPFPPSPGYVMVIDWPADANSLKVDAGVVPPILPPTTPLDVTTPAFWVPVGIAWLRTSTVAYVADTDVSVAAPATDGIIGVKVTASLTPPGSPIVSDKTTLYFADSTPADDATPNHYGVAVDNDDSEVVFCDTGTASINHYGIDGILVASVPATPGFTPIFITCQSGTGIGGPPGGGGGGGGGSGGTPYNDNGADIGDNHKSGHHKRSKCGLTGAEAPLLFGLWLLSRRRSKKSAK